MKIRIATFNANNLFARYRFKEGRETLATDGFSINDLAFSLYNDTAKRLTAKAIKEAQADIICLQEVENMHVLERFNSSYIYSQKHKYKHRMLIDSHDPRFIDVAILSKYPIKNVKTYREQRNKKNSWWLFSRDCLEVEFDIKGISLVLYGNHFKSMIGKNFLTGPEGRAETKPKREEQVEKVVEIIETRWKDGGYSGNFAVLGDFNDYLEGDSSILPLVNHSGLENVTEHRPPDDRWTHYWADEGDHKQLDYILLSKGLFESSNDEGVFNVDIMRKGLPWNAYEFEGERFEGVGEDEPKASDHAPLYVDVFLKNPP